MSGWKMNRAGFLNFWYYDNEIFNFEDGKMLLRGSNGSGKSVTMQSLIPLLLDGDKRPERLDPFGSKARKIDNYLLNEDTDEDERTGYIFMEFKKSSSDTYITIGLGIRAKKNSQTSSWGFCIIDGRRVGIDFELAKTTTGQIPLSKKELENRLGIGGFVTDRMQEYMSKVNELLFGYSNVEDYAELIKLLIQLRSPKLSKDFKPTVLYEIMTNSLPTLTDEDLRPMSEAIESMDATKSKLESLIEARKSLNKIKNVYDNYNKFLMYEKTNNLLESDKAYKHISKEEKQKNIDIADKNTRIDVIKKSIEQLKLEQKYYKEKQESLKDRDEYRIIENLKEFENKIEQDREDLLKKNKKYEEKKQKEVDINHKIRKDEDEIGLKLKSIKSILEDMDNFSEDIGFDEHEFMSGEINSKIEDEYDFLYLQKSYNMYVKLLKEGLELLREKDKILEKFYEKEKHVDNCNKIMDNMNRDLKHSEEIFIELKEEFVEKVNIFNQNNNYLKIPNSKMEKIIELVYNYSISDYFDNIKKVFSEVLNQQLKDIEIKIGLKQNEINEKQKEIDIKTLEQKEWENKQDPEPNRKTEIINSRKKLEKLKIPFIPLYKAVDFNDDIDEIRKGIIEEALVEMGLLDALIIPKKHMNEVLKMDNSICDKYIFSEPSYLSYELSKIMHVDKSHKDVFDNIDDVLKSILIDENKNTFISEDGIYGLGILRGKVTGSYEPKYIGVTARKQYKEKKLLELSSELKLLIDHRSMLESDLKECVNIKDKMLEEADKFPSEDELNQAKNILADSKKSLDRSIEELNIAKEELEKIEKEVTKIKEKCYYACDKIYIEPKNVETVSSAIEIANEYDKSLNNLINEHKNYINLRKNIKEKLENREEIEIDISELIGEVEKLKRSIAEIEVSIKNIKETLEFDKMAKIEEEIKECIEKIDEIPKQIINFEREESSLTTSIEHITNDILELEHRKNEIEFKLKFLTSQFIEEYNLGFFSQVQYDFEKESVISIAHKILSDLEDVRNSKRSLRELGENLGDIYHKERNMLAEYRLSLEHIGDRSVINAKYVGKLLNFYELKIQIEENIQTQSQIIQEKDRVMFEDILANNLSKKIRARINHSKSWVNDMNKLMESLNTSSGLTFSLNWLGKKAENEDELSSEDLVKFLSKDSKLMKQDDIEKFIKHFKYKIEKSRILMLDKGENKSFHAIIKDVLDYRKWFEFKLYFTKTNEKKRELTNNAFFTFSGGEKAMAMYVPLFSAVYARYSGAKSNCPRIISLDEAFAGVDSKNIRDMFRLLDQLNLDFIMNSQVLWGDYDTVSKLSIVEIIRPNNSSTVSLIRYKWNGKIKEMVI